MSSVTCSNLTKSFYSGGTEVKALRGIDLTVQSGELLMLVGPSGCGKTTLISVVAGILDHDMGECHVLGQDLKRMSASEKISFRRDNVGFVFQAFNLIPTLNCLENVAIPLTIKGVKAQVAEEKAAESLERVGLGDKILRSPRDLSGGQQQRVAICRALIHDPKLLVCDEPTSALDHETGMKIMDLFRDVSLSKERCVIVVTHDARIFSYADRIAYMDDGVIESIEHRARNDS